MNKNHPSTKAMWLFYLFILLLVVSRLLPHPPNFTPVGALGVFIGAYATARWQWLIPIAALLVSDFFIGFYNMNVMLCVYLAVFSACVIGHFGLFNKIKLSHLIVTGFASALVFFLLSNLGVWLAGELYPRTGAGLVQCYVAAIPFFGNTLAGYATYMTLAFGLYEFSQRQFKLKTV